MTADLSGFAAWWNERCWQQERRVTRVALNDLDGWMINGETGDITHHTGRFFAVRGLRVRIGQDDPREWSQPILVQPDVGILGFLVRVIDGELHLLMQAKMEPGNINDVQLSPTVQATPSNYRRVHRGGGVPYLEYFESPQNGRRISDTLQSEQGSWFLAKRNRNMIVQVDHAVPLHSNFRWVSLDELSLLLRIPNLVNMDARSVLAGLPSVVTAATLLSDGPGRPRHSTAELVSWLTDAKARCRLDRTLVPLSSLSDWKLCDGEITHLSGRYFRIIGVDVRAAGREVDAWSQPMLEPCSRGLVGFVGRLIDDVFHVLVRAETQSGTRDLVELGATVRCTPGNPAGTPEGHGSPFLDAILEPDPARTLVDIVHSEEGGRFYHAETRYVVVEAPDAELDVGENYIWMTPQQLASFIRYGGHVDIGVRCLMTCLAGTRATVAAQPSASTRIFPGFGDGVLDRL